MKKIHAILENRSDTIQDAWIKLALNAVLGTFSAQIDPKTIARLKKDLPKIDPQKAIITMVEVLGELIAARVEAERARHHLLKQLGGLSKIDPSDEQELEKISRLQGPDLAILEILLAAIPDPEKPEAASSMATLPGALASPLIKSYVDQKFLSQETAALSLAAPSGNAKPKM